MTSIGNVAALQYVDRSDGNVRTDPIYAASFMDWCYNSRPGTLLTRLLLTRRFASALYGWYYRQPWTRGKVAAFAAAMGVNVNELEQPLGSFGSFSEFISRRIDLSKRRIDPDPSTCISPVDGRVLVYGSVSAASRFRIKSSEFDLGGLLGGGARAARYDGGAVAIMRLYLADYHHFHFPDAGTPEAAEPVSGRYFAVTPYSRTWAVPFYAENFRVITPFASDAFGQIAMVEVGAFTVGSIRQQFTPGARVARGAYKGVFELGASIVVLVFEPGAIRFDEDLRRNTAAGLETFVRMGERIGQRGGA
jgi:phosphatidylserine decarboxylase